MAKLLVIDDDKDTCEFLKDFFESRKCAVLTAHSGEDGLRTMKEKKPDIILLDIKMKGMNGLEVLKEVKNFDKNIKVIIITVASDEETRQKAEQYGADDFIKKPLNTEYLEGAVCRKFSDRAQEGKGPS